MKSFRESRKAISPVISTIIIVAVAIAISIAVAFWLGGITGIFTRFEKIEIPTAYAEKTDGETWEIHLVSVKNTGTTDTSITNVLVNGIPTDDVSPKLPIYLKAGETHEEDIVITITSDGTTYSSGQAVTVTLHTSGGQDYPKTVVLP